MFAHLTLALPLMTAERYGVNLAKYSPGKLVGIPLQFCSVEKTPLSVVV